jgi:hypothetical protein
MPAKKAVTPAKVGSPCIYLFFIPGITGDNDTGPILCIRPSGIFAQNGARVVIASDPRNKEQVYTGAHEAAAINGLTVDELVNLTQVVPKAGRMTSEELMNMRPQRKSKAKAKATTMGPDERNWLRGEETELGAFLWYCRIGDLKLIGNTILRIPNFSDVKTRAEAINLIYASLTVDDAPDPLAASSGAEIQAAPDAAEVHRVPLSTYTNLYIT